MKVHSRALLRISGANRVSPSGAEKKWLGLSCFLLRARLLVRLHIGSLWPGGILHILDPDSLVLDVLDGFRWLWCKWTGSVGVRILREDMAKTPGLTRMESGKQIIGVFMGLPLKESLKTQLTLTKARAVVGSLQPLF